MGRVIQNKRTFPRRRMNVDFDLVVGGEVVRAVLTDLTPGGMALLIRGRSDLNTQVLDLKIRDIELNATGRIVWKREMFSGLKVGVSRMGPLEGTFDNYRFADLLYGIQKAGKTGVLHIEADGSRRKIFYRDGQIVYSSSDRDDLPLADRLLAAERISPRQYQQTLSLAGETGKPQETVLVEMRYLSPQELVQTVRQKAESVILDLCSLADAKFFFREEALPRDEIMALRLSINELLYQGAKKAECFSLFKKTYVEQDALLSVSPDAAVILERMALDPDDRAVLSLIKGRTLLSQLSAVSPLDRDHTLKAIYALCSAQVLELDPEQRDEQESETAAVPEEIPIDPVLAERVDRLYQEYKTLGYHGVLGLLPHATRAEIKHAYHTMAKEYHPDRYLMIQSGAFREKLNVIFAYINEAYRELSKTGPDAPQESPRSPERQEEPRIDKRAMAREKYQLGRQSLHAGDDDQAMMLLGQAVYLDGAHADYHFFYGVALLRNKKAKEAEAAMRKALQLSPDQPDYLAELGHLYLKLGFMLRAKNTFEKILKIRPAHARALEGLAAVERQQKS